MLSIYLTGWIATTIISYKVFFLEAQKEAIVRLADKKSKTSEETDVLEKLQHSLNEDRNLYVFITYLVWAVAHTVIWPLMFLSLILAQKPVKEKMIKAFMVGELNGE